MCRMNFGSNYVFNFMTNTTFDIKNPNWTYAWGVDPVWKGATNELLYYNSLKMKTSVIIGIFQMTLGLFLHLLNSVYFRNWLDVWFEFVPRLLFMWCTFGYLVFIIFVKWNTNYFAHDGIAERSSLAPPLLNVMIRMFLGGDDLPANVRLYPGQYIIERILVIIAFICIPWMFFPKPFVLHLDHNAKKNGVANWWVYMLSGCKGIHQDEHRDEDQAAILPHDEQHGHGGGEDGPHGEDITELWVHQGLETIEFVLGCISHTASYLRLWALSLAHSELSTVFYDKILSDNWATGFTVGQPADAHGGMPPTLLGWLVLIFVSFIGVAIWLAATLGIIMAMEVLSAFLHALRLHWVEFQSKFYKGDGHLFRPFVYKPPGVDDVEEEMS